MKFLHSSSENSSLPEKKSFLWIKQNLDPEWSYIVFENSLKRRENSLKSSIFDSDCIFYASLAREEYGWLKVFDEERECEFLVIRIPPGNEEKVLGRVLGYGFPEETVYYLYKKA
ncbi:hypothetical protein MTBBW1_1380017 [Desulfamplus magnetovallimortis]|uniref:Uncharacterized protein n=1 Tax=Desulfamplus magnetovallimortis TaxID=1246637 RepID=A0A1W1H7K7_9BACT|nr:hypothetical protein [Desulfamplus magnetovallimortis]SLM28470.1 hypothetical protein MTBBW1_1380017 [Desulfamplus magnetovallimortis]